jgi:putative flippase GtrA
VLEGRCVIARTSIAYLAVSGTCWLAHNATMIVGDAAGLPLIASAVTSFLLVCAIGYLLHSRFTFAARRSWHGFWRYSAAMLPNLPLSTLLLWLLTAWAGLPMVAAAPAGTLIMLGANFFATRWAISIRQPRRCDGGALR